MVVRLKACSILSSLPATLIFRVSSLEIFRLKEMTKEVSLTDVAAELVSSVTSTSVSLTLLFALPF